MPPEALIAPPHYSNELDCFSYGVLTIQIITWNFPTLDTCLSVEDPIECRRKDIELVASDHPLLPIALRCLHNRATERPLADEMCEELAMLKGEEMYTHSTEQTNDQGYTKSQGQRDKFIARERADHRNALERERNAFQRERDDHRNALQRERDVLQRERAVHQNEIRKERDSFMRERADHLKEVKAKDELIQQLQDNCLQHLQKERKDWEKNLCKVGT